MAAIRSNVHQADITNIKKITQWLSIAANSYEQFHQNAKGWGTENLLKSPRKPPEQITPPMQEMFSAELIKQWLKGMLAY